MGGGLETSSQPLVFQVYHFFTDVVVLKLSLISSLDTEGVESHLEGIFFSVKTAAVLRRFSYLNSSS